jgi:expansin (peptidoglycan-binding protein)
VICFVLHEIFPQTCFQNSAHFLLSFLGLQKGRATGYVVESTGACGFGTYRDQWTFAPNTIFFNGSNVCGACFEVTGPLGTHIMMAADLCPVGDNAQWCSGDLVHFDLNEDAFPTFGEEAWGVTLTSVRPIVCPTSSPVSIIVGWGAEPYNPAYLQVHMFNHKVPIASVKVADLNMHVWQTLLRTDYNAWEFDPGRTIVYPVVYAVTSVYGETINVSIPNYPTAKGQKIDGTLQFTQWTTVTENTCPSFYQYNIFVNGLSNDGTHRTAEDWMTDDGTNLAFTSSLPNNATKAAQKTINNYQEWGFYTPGASIPSNLIAGVELQVRTPNTQPGLQLIWGEYNEGFIASFSADITSTWKYYYFPKSAFGNNLPALQKIAFKNSQNSVLTSLTVANFRIVPEAGVIIAPRT